ncbi:MAG: sigma-54 interaction domain-containing protein [Planctomycetota bacterium]
MSNDVPAAPSGQLLRYARDLAQLYAQQTRLERQLFATSRAMVSLARALSLEEMVRGLVEAVSALEGGPAPCVYVLRGSRLHLAAPLPVPDGVPHSLEVLDGALTPAPLESYPGVPSELGTVIPLAGRRRVEGGLLLRGPRERGSAHTSLLLLLAEYAGVVLENLLLERRRQGSGGVGRGEAEADLGARLHGESAAMRRVLALVARLAPVDSTVLLEGETGTGKSLLARHVHELSPRRKKPFVAVNCAAIPAQLVESELFGHEQGAFTGATKRRKGYAEQAEGGTLFLDEVGELPLAVQAKMLTFLEDRQFAHVGGERALRADVRLIAATNQDLDVAVREGRFRADLLYRLQVFRIELPPLRERREDVLGMAEDLARQVAERYALPAPQLSAVCRAQLLAYDWPGNARELRNAMEKAVVLSDGGVLDPEILPGRPRSPEPELPVADLPRSPLPAVSAGPAASATVPDEVSDPGELELSFADAKKAVIERWEAGYFARLLESTGGNVAEAARRAQMDKKHVHRKAKGYGIDLEALRED